jgi:hypothetical protein
MIGEEEVRGKPDLASLEGEGIGSGVEGDKGESRVEGKGTEPSPGNEVGSERNSGGVRGGSGSSWSSSSSLKWKTGCFAGFRFGREPRETKAPGPLSSVNVALQERVRLCITGLDEESGDEDNGVE